MAVLTVPRTRPKRPATRRVRGALASGLAVTILWSWQVSPAHAQGPTLEYAVKASYLTKFAPFVEWPPRVFATSSSPFNICVVGEDPFGGVLDDTVRGQTWGTHPMAVVRLAAVGPGQNCQLLFVGRSVKQLPTEALGAVTGQPVLTVTDQSRGVSGGMIQFIMKDGRVRFAIDAAAAEAGGVPVSSKLLELALFVHKAGK